MLNKLKLKRNNKVSLYIQLADAVKQKIDVGILEKEFLMPSINEFSRKLSISRDTVGRAYNFLKKKELIESVPGIGHFVRGKKIKKIKILVVFDELDFFKKIIYDEFLRALGNKAIVDLRIYYYNPRLFKEIIYGNIGNYTYCVIMLMPPFETNTPKNEYMRVIDSIPDQKLVLLYKRLPRMRHIMGVFQDFNDDIHHALITLKTSLEKYNDIILVLPVSGSPSAGMIEEVTNFGSRYNKKVEILSNAPAAKLRKKQAYT